MGSSWKRQGVEEPFCHNDRRMGEHTFLTFSSFVCNSLIKYDKFCQPTRYEYTKAASYLFTMTTLAPSLSFSPCYSWEGYSRGVPLCPGRQPLGLAAGLVLGHDA